MEFSAPSREGSSLRRYFTEFFNFPGMACNLWRHRDLISMMAWRDFSSRYRGSMGGLLWSLIQPIVMMAVYTVVFSLFLKIRFTTDASPLTFSVYLLCGLLPWNAFSEGLQVSKDVIRSNTNLVKRVVFPLEILPLNAALTATIHQLIGFLLLIPLCWGVNRGLYVTLLLVPAILVMQLLLAVGLNWIAASLAVYLPDLGQIVSLLLGVWFFLTPIFYPEDVAPPQAGILFQVNPMARLVRLYRDAFMTGQWPTGESLWVTLLICLFIFLCGYFWFMHSKKGFADVL
jgi:lipopolysaccharide transport system permease protein